MVDGGAVSLNDEFLEQYHRAGVQTAFYASIGAALIFLTFLVIALIFESASGPAIWMRLAVVALLGAGAFTMYAYPSFSTTNYVAITTSVSGLTLACTVYLLSLYPEGVLATNPGVTPALIFGLMLHYGFLRLPALTAVLVGGFVSLGCLFLLAPSYSPMIAQHANTRIAIYLFFANLAGFFICRTTQTRERELFHARRRAEVAQEALNTRANAAEEAHLDKTRLLAAVSHDLRQPMMAVRSYLGTLMRRLERGDAGQARRQADLLSKSVDILGETLDHVLTSARYDSGTEPITVAEVELAPILSRLRETFATEAATRGLELRIRIPDQPIAVTTDAIALWRILMNIVSNALKFTAPDGRIGRGVLVNVRMKGDVCQIVVSDTGIGISKESLETIWLPYFQISNTERNRERGLGLGLFLVRRAVEQLPGHSLALRSTLGRGTRFTVSLPGHRVSRSAEVEAAKELLSDDELNELQGGFALILEDDPSSRQAFEELLNEWNMVFVSGADLHDLLIECEHSARLPDVIISDFRLPGELNGADCVRVLRRRLESDVPAVIVTGEANPGDVRRVLPDGAVLIPKPFDPVVLAASLLDAVRKARRAEQM
jgi:signal transduction histidine kinase/CheY-like chemotaxis protein